jgi:hypothetical protein
VGGAATYLLKQLGESGQLQEFQQTVIDTLRKQLDKTLKDVKQLQAKERDREITESKAVDGPESAAKFGNDVLHAHGASTGTAVPLPARPVARNARVDVGSDSWQYVCWSPMAAGC